MAERKKVKHPAPETTVRPGNDSVGETLRAARVAKGMEVDDVSQSIHIRPTQLRAIEENNIESLPGMTYAVGFVRSYANFLGLNGAEIVHRFKAEQGHNSTPSKLSFPEPVTESVVPDPMMVGVGAFLAVVILVLWTVYSNMHGSSKTAEKIPAAPVVTSVAEGLPSAAPPAEPTPPATAATTDTTPAAPAAEAQPSSATATPAAAVAAPAPDATPTAAAPASETPAAPPVVANTEQPAAAVPTISAAAQAKEAGASPAADSEDDTADEADDTAPAVSKAAEKKKDDSVIKIKRSKSRITLKATQASWVQVTDAKQNVLYRKVLRPGEQYSVPDQPGLILDTANAGGLNIVVDGKQVQPVGKDGEIVRDISLDPQQLKIQRMQVRD